MVVEFGAADDKTGALICSSIGLGNTQLVCFASQETCIASALAVRSSQFAAPSAGGTEPGPAFGAGGASHTSPDFAPPLLHIPLKDHTSNNAACQHTQYGLA